MKGSPPRAGRARGARPEAPAGADGAANEGVPVLSAARRRGRAATMGAYYGLAAVISVLATVQIIRQVFFAETVPAPWGSCREGLLALNAAVERARDAASGTEGEDAALDGFRRALEPEWRNRDAVAAACLGSRADERALDAIERLRYAEEHAVRHEAGDLAPLRRRVQTIVQNDLLVAPTTATQLPAAPRPERQPR